MEKICLDNILSALLFYGFDKVDSLLLYYTTKNVLTADEFKFVLDQDSLPTLFKYVEFKDNTYQLKNGMSLSDEVEVGNKIVMPIKNILALHSNKKLMKYLKSVDFSNIILQKITNLKPENINEVAYLFSTKEKNIISNGLGLEFEEKNIIK